MTDVTPTLITTSANEQPTSGRKTPLEDGKWNPKVEKALLVSFEEPTKIDLVQFDNQNTDQPIRFRVALWFQTPTQNENPNKEVIKL